MAGSDENLDRTREVDAAGAPGATGPGDVGPPGDPERTQAVATAPGSALDATRIARELAGRGVPPDEIARLLALDRQPASATPPVAADVPSEPPYEPHPTLMLPPHRAASPAECAQSDRLVTSANVARRRGAFAEAERLCMEAAAIAPGNAEALELLGDVMQGTGRVDDAVYAYRRSHEADPGRRSAERKYAELMLRQNREIALLRDEFVPRNPTIAVMLSALFPGAGQVYNGDGAKGLAIALGMLICVAILGWTPLGFRQGMTGIPAGLVLFVLVAGGLYIAGVVDANLSARRGRKRRSGWEV
ncbi:MAG: hypothetical protein IT208_07260 [Chthonomonadales bacterium]|nr:hypothetical protein [Chthonomonadales bacterium]